MLSPTQLRIIVTANLKIRKFDLIKNMFFLFFIANYMTPSAFCNHYRKVGQKGLDNEV